MKLDLKAWIDKMMKVQSMSFTRENNSYVNATDFARISGTYIGNNGVISVNLYMSSSMANNVSNIKIGTMSPKPRQAVLMNVPCQANNSTILFEVNTSGEIKLHNYSGTATGANWFRSSIPVIV